MSTKIILLTGKAVSGKSTACEFLINKLIKTYYPASSKCEVVEYSFATPLKQFCVNVLGLSPHQVWGTNEDKNLPTHIKWANMPIPLVDKMKLFKDSRNKEYDPNEFMTGREVLQVFGSNICRHIVPDCWAKATRQNILRDKLAFAIISDARFPNELDVFQDLNPIVIRFTRNPLDKKHISETALDDYDFSKFKNLIMIDNKELSVEAKNEMVFEKVMELLK